MTVLRTKLRKERKELIKGIIENFVVLFGLTDERIEKIPMLKLRNIKLDSEDFLKWCRGKHREMIRQHIYTFNQDGTAKTLSKNEDLSEVKP